MSARQFKVGDNVKVVEGNEGNEDYVGLMGIIVEDDGTDSIPYLVEFKTKIHGSTKRWFDAHELKTVAGDQSVLEKFQAWVNENFDDISDVPAAVEEIAADVFGVRIEPASSFTFTPIEN
jgi:hypothetical protein